MSANCRSINASGVAVGSLFAIGTGDMGTIAFPIFARPFSIANPAAAGCNSDWAQYSNTPVLHHSAWAGFEDDGRSAWPKIL